MCPGGLKKKCENVSRVILLWLLVGWQNVHFGILEFLAVLATPPASPHSCCWSPNAQIRKNRDWQSCWLPALSPHFLLLCTHHKMETWSWGTWPLLHASWGSFFPYPVTLILGNMPPASRFIGQLLPISCVEVFFFMMRELWEEVL